jgi:hypothetical protein
MASSELPFQFAEGQRVVRRGLRALALAASANGFAPWNQVAKTIETLARVRRPARNTPASQIHIAREGGQQVNVQGDANRRKATLPGE